MFLGTGQDFPATFKYVHTTSPTSTVLKTEEFLRPNFTNNEADMLGLVAALEPAQEGDTIITDSNVCVWWMTNGKTNARRDLDNLCRKARELSLSKGIKVLWRPCNQSFAGQYNEAFHSYRQHQQHDRSNLRENAP